MDETATHFLLRLTPSLKPVGTIRAYQANGAIHYKLSRLAVLKDFRKFRFGRELVLALHEWVRSHALQVAGLGEQGFAEIVSHSQIPVKGFYAKSVTWVDLGSQVLLTPRFHLGLVMNPK